MQKFKSMLTQEQLDAIIDKNNLLTQPTKPTQLSEDLRGSALFESLQKPVQSPIAQPQIQSQQPGFLDRLKSRFISGRKEAEEAQRAEDVGEITKPEEFLRRAGAGAEFIAETGFDALIQGIKGLSKLSEKISGTEGAGERLIETSGRKMADFLETESGKSVLEIAQTGGDLWKSFKNKHPRAAENVESVAKLAEFLPAGKVAKTTSREVKAGVKFGKDIVEEVAKPRILAKTKGEIDNIVGRITQGSKDDIVKATRALRELDTTGVESFTDLKKLTEDSIGEIAKKQDDILSSVKDVKKLDDFTRVVAGKDQNFVKRAIEQLKEFYEKTEDYVNLEKLDDLELKFKTQGISALEINDLARDFSREMPSAFSRITGEPLTSVNKVAMERTRKELKDLARDFLPNDASKLLDRQMSDLYKLKETSEKMEKTVQKLSNKIKKRGLFEKVARGIGRGVDVATFGTVRGFLTSFMPSNIGNKVLNSLDIEESLVRNLKKLDRLNERIDRLSDDNAVSALVGILKDVQKSEAGFAKLPGNPRISALEDTLKSYERQYHEATKVYDKKRLDKLMQQTKRKIENLKLEEK